MFLFIYLEDANFPPYELSYGYHDLHEADQGEAHAEAHQAAHVGHKPGHGGLLTIMRMKHLS